uniref:Fibronectin type-III domain-containing protein n=1 Tax=Amphimedon queenslandica TaxID=400682 RepID=A0A1X7T7A1_AMPQE
MHRRCLVFSSVESVSMTVSWDEVPCNGRNGPITGYYLTYTNITSNTSYTVNITGGENRMYNLIGLIQYTNYTVSIIPYNYNMNGPARQEIQLTGESIPGVISDLRHAKDPDALPFVWNPPTIPNVGLIPNTSYTIGVRAYTSIGPGEWTNRKYSTAQIFVLELFSVTKLSSTAVRAEWNLIRRVSHYTVYYESTSSSSRKKRQVETGMRVFPGDTTEGLIGGLDPNLKYLFSISTSFNVNGIIYEGERTQPIPPGVTLTATIISSTSSVITVTGSSTIQLRSVPGLAPISTTPSNGVQLYLPYEDRMIPDYSMIYGSQFYDTDQNNDSISDALWCQSADTSANIGVWYYPNGTELPLFDGTSDDLLAPSPVFSKRFFGQIALARNGGLSGYEGLYKCIIPDENGVNQTLVVGAYTDTGYNNNDGPDADPTMQFSLLSTSRLATPPVFSLSFNVSNSPPRTISCSVNGNGISTELSRVIVNGSGSVTRVRVTVRLRETGNYQCTVFNDRITDGINGRIGNVQALSSTTSLTLSVSDTPTGLTATRLSTGLAHVRLSWSTVSGATGYEVYYQLSSNTPVSAGTTASTTINITSGLFQGLTYTFYVVSYSSTSLPSGDASVMVTFSNSIVNDLMGTVITNFAITLTWSSPTAVVPDSYNINRRCRRVCESSLTSNSETSVSSPHTSTGIPPYSQCGFDLIGAYGAEITYLTTNYVATTTLSTAPTAPVGDIIFSSVESVSMTVSWDEVPCNGRNGPITGYYLTYTNITSNTSYTVNITGGDNRMYNLTGLIPYTNYTVSIIPYNYNMNGPARQEIQLTTESIPGVITDLLHATSPTVISIIWNPTIPNGIITVYEIRYRESTSTGPYNITNTTNTYYSIVGLIPNTSYTIGVRAYTSIGPGEWTDREINTCSDTCH